MASKEEGNARRPGEEGCDSESQSPHPSIELDVDVIHNLSKALGHAIRQRGLSLLPLVTVSWRWMPPLSIHPWSVSHDRSIDSIMRWSDAFGRGVQIVRSCSSISIYSCGLLMLLRLFLAAVVTIPTAWCVSLLVCMDNILPIVYGNPTDSVCILPIVYGNPTNSVWKSYR